ncbi:acyl-CoA synthetase [Kitasatospora sp. KL5]|uniref:acyl-CoA synthetase n=1 Tax=Kitasatospora sp. KL5 TaxID=3425125 RepID=UPI003D6F2294
MTGDELLWPRYTGPADLSAVETVPLEARGLPASTHDLLVRAARRWPDRTALTVLPDAARWRTPLQYTFAGLLARVHRYANLLHRLGVRRGDAVALMAPNCAELVPATLAAQLAGIAAPLNGSLAPAHLAELLRRSGARIMVAAGPELAPDVWAKIPALAGGLDVVLVLRPTASAGEPAPLPQIDGLLVADLAGLAAVEDASAFTGTPPGPGDLAAFFHTGGTTGTPKLAAHTHRNEVANGWMIAADPQLDGGAVVFAALPLFHVNALLVTLLAPLFKGRQVVWAGPLGYREPALYGEFWKIVEHYRITAMSAVPTVYAVLAQCPVDADITSLRHAMVGASPLPAAVRDSFQARTGAVLVEGYGLTEATCASARSFPGTPRPGAVGQRMPYQRLKAVHPETWEELPAGRTGLLAISGPTVFAGYVTGRDATGRPVLDGLGKLVDGWLDTGDLARVDADGFVHLSGRAKDLIIRGGHNIDPAVVEDALLAHPQVTAAGAVGRPDAHAGEVPVAYVTLAPGADLTEDRLLAWAAEHVPEAAAAPKTVTVLDTLPVTDVGKPYKLALRADATRRALAEALTGIGGGINVDTAVEDGTVTVSVTAAGASEADRAAAGAVLDRYAVPWTWTWARASADAAAVPTGEAAP